MFHLLLRSRHVGNDYSQQLKQVLFGGNQCSKVGMCVKSNWHSFVEICTYLEQPYFENLMHGFDRTRAEEVFEVLDFIIFGR